MIVRLWEREEPEGLVVSVLERSEAELARGAFVGASRPQGAGRVLDVTVTGRGPLRQEAERVLALSRRKVKPTDREAGPVAAAREAIQDVALPAAPTRIKRGKRGGV